MVVQQNLELDLKSSKADVLLLVRLLSFPISANMSCSRCSWHHSGHPGTFMLRIGMPEPASALVAQVVLVVSDRKGKGAGMGGGFYFGDEMKQDTAALPRNLASIAAG